MRSLFSKTTVAVLIATVSPAMSDSLQCLQRNIYWEARNQSITGQVLVAWTTLNRTDDPRWPNTVCDVVYQSHQFSWTIGGNTGNVHAPGEAEVWQTAGQVARATWISWVTDAHDPSGGATHFHTRWITPSWSHHLQVTRQEQDHVFYK